jgi:hypothetical protein
MLVIGNQVSPVPKLIARFALKQVCLPDLFRFESHLFSGLFLYFMDHHVIR